MPLKLSEESSYRAKEILLNCSCYFRISYISSYLLVRGCIERIKKIEFIKSTSSSIFFKNCKTKCSWNEWLVYDIANALDIPKEKLLTSKEMQLTVLKNIFLDNKIKIWF